MDDNLTTAAFDTAAPNAAPRASMNIEALKMGGMMAALLIVYTVVLHFAGLILSTPAGLLSLVLVVLGIYLGVRNYRDRWQGGYISYGRAFGMSMLILLYGSILYGLFMYVYYSTFGADTIPALMQKSEEATYEMMKGFGMSEDKIEETIEQSQRSMNPTMLSLGHAGNLIFYGAILSLIVSIFLKRNPERNEPPL